MRDELLSQLRREDLIDRNAVTYAQFRRGLVPRWRTVWLHIASAWLVLIGSCLLLASLSHRSLWLDLVLVAIGSVVLGYVIAYIQLFLHEAAHFNLHPRRDHNDILCNLFVSGVTGQDVRKYRVIHWQHHKHLGTPQDTEITYWSPLSVKFLVEALSGIRVTKVLLLRRQKLSKSGGDSQQAAAAISPVPAAALIVNTAFVAVIAYWHQWPLLFAWVGALLVFFPFFGALRQVLEHRSGSAEDAVDYARIPHGAVHRLFGDGPISSTFGGAGFNRHLLHHWEPSISYTNLHELEQYLLNTECAAFLRARQTSYVQVLCSLFRPIWK